MTSRVIQGDCRDVMRSLIAEGVRVQCVVTSPPYWGLRDYGVAGQLGLESTPAAFVAGMVEVFGLVRELLADDGTLWLNLGDSYAGAPGGFQGKNGDRASRTFTARIGLEKRGLGLKPKDLVGIPWRVAFALQASGWWLRQDIIWSKPNPMPESIKDRCTKAHEYLFLLTKRERYYYDADAIKEPGSINSHGSPNVNPGWKQEAVGNNQGGSLGQWPPANGGSTRNRRSVWTVATQPYAEAHFATFPEALVEPCILAGSRPGDIVFDPFMGSGTVASVAQRLGRRWLGSELNPAYIELIERRTRGSLGLELSA